MALFGPSPYKAEEDELSHIPDVNQQYLAPYANTGLRLNPALQGGYAGLALNPGAEQSRLGSGYQQSPGYQWDLNQQLGAANSAQAAGGMVGSPQNQQFDEKTAHGFADQDYDQYYKHNQSLFNTGVSGLQGLETQGYNASNQLTHNLDDYYNNLANVMGAQAANRHNIGYGGIGLGLGYALKPSAPHAPAPVESLT